MEAQFQINHNQDRQDSKTNFKEFALREAKKGQGHHKPFRPGPNISSELSEGGKGAASPEAPGNRGPKPTRRRPAGTRATPTGAAQPRPTGASPGQPQPVSSPPPKEEGLLQPIYTTIILLLILPPTLPPGLFILAIIVITLHLQSLTQGAAFTYPQERAREGIDCQVFTCKFQPAERPAMEPALDPGERGSSLRSPTGGPDPRASPTSPTIHTAPSPPTPLRPSSPPGTRRAGAWPSQPHPPSSQFIGEEA